LSDELSTWDVGESRDILTLAAASCDGSIAIQVVSKKIYDRIRDISNLSGSGIDACDQSKNIICIVQC
jgi:hypothetical protein